MERERPPYLGNLPRDRRGNWTLYLLAALLLAALVGGWKVYTNTVAGWHVRFNGAPAERPMPGRLVEGRTREEQAEYLRQEAERERHMEARQRELDAAWEKERASWRCVRGTPFRQMPGGGWENVPGQRC